MHLDSGFSGGVGVRVRVRVGVRVRVHLDFRGGGGLRLKISLEPLGTTWNPTIGPSETCGKGEA